MTARQLLKSRAKGPDPIDIEVGAKIKARRRLLDMSQEDLGKALGVTFQQVQKYEKGTNRVSASRLQRIATVLHVQATYFFPNGGNGTEHVSAVAAEELSRFIATDEGRDLNTAFARIASPALRKKIVGLVKTIAGHAEGNR